MQEIENIGNIGDADQGYGLYQNQNQDAMRSMVSVIEPGSEVERDLMEYIRMKKEQENQWIRLVEIEIIIFSF